MQVAVVDWCQVCVRECVCARVRGGGRDREGGEGSRRALFPNITRCATVQ